MNDNHMPRQGSKCFKAGVCGTIVAAVCCATPVLAVALASLGFAALVPKLDYILFPVVLIFVLLAIYGWRKGRSKGDQLK
jgi:mercuric ion transport protein